MRLLKWILISSIMGVLAACASSQVVTPPPMPSGAPVEPSVTPLIAATAPAEPSAITQQAIGSATAAPVAKSTFIFLWEPG